MQLVLRGNNDLVDFVYTVFRYMLTAKHSRYWIDFHSFMLMFREMPHKKGKNV